ncbi:MAG TPA: hypothetical protein ENK36_05150 [Desulfobacterales bacterium]|nr:hypothetical protein [Desulfobacterales bacterium]
MKPKERIRAILDGKKVDRFPVDLWYTPEINASLKSYFGVEDDFDLYKALDLDKIVWAFPEYKQNSIGNENESHIGPNAGGLRTEWGVPLKKIQAGKAVYYEHGEAPLKNYETPESLEDYPYWPDPDKYDYISTYNLAKRASENYAVIGPWVSFYEIYCQVRGLEQSMMDLALYPDLANAILDKIEESQTFMMKRFFDQSAKHMDMCFISDDMGSQQSLLISIPMWETFFKDRMKRWCDLIHSYGLKVFYHTDGASELLIPNLIECGIDILNPIQHVCPGMEMKNLKDKYGDKLIFHGAVENQSVLPFGTTEDVKLETLECLETLGRDGKGYIPCSCHNIQPGTPVENILTLVETVKNYKL